MKYRFLGDSCAVVLEGKKIDFTKFGEVKELDEKTVQIVVSFDKIPIIPDEEFQTLGFLDDELKRFPSAAAQGRAPQEFHEKKKAALIAAREFANSLKQDPSKEQEPINAGS